MEYECWFRGQDEAFLEGRAAEREAQHVGDVTAAEATPPVTLEEVLHHLTERRWDVASLAAQLTDAQMGSLSPADRVRLIDVISRGLVIFDEDEQVIVRLLITTPPAQARAVRDQLDTGLLEQIDQAIEVHDDCDYNDALRQLFFQSLTPAQAAEATAGARVFPWANPGLIHALWNVRFCYEACELRDDGKIHVRYWTHLAPMDTRREDVRLDPFEMIAIRFLDPEEHAGVEVGQTVYMPAINLRSLHRHQPKGAL